jgi:hypothetical protein
MSSEPEAGENSMLGISRRSASRKDSALPGIWPPLFAAIFCTGLIVEAIFTAKRSRANGDMMLIFVPLLGAAFLAIPASQAWWMCVKILRGKRGG